jgi:hypothetical protein
MFSSNGYQIKGSVVGDLITNIKESKESQIFELKDKGKVYAIRGSSRLPVANTWAWSQVVLLKIADDKKTIPKIVFKTTYWYEKGYDDGEYWSEAATEHYEQFILDDPGKYKLKIFGESQVGHNRNSIYAEMRSGVTNRSLIKTFGILFLVLAVIGFFLTSFIYTERAD